MQSIGDEFWISNKVSITNGFGELSVMIYIDLSLIGLFPNLNIVIVEIHQPINNDLRLALTDTLIKLWNSQDSAASLTRVVYWVVSEELSEGKVFHNNIANFVFRLGVDRIRNMRNVWNVIIDPMYPRSRLEVFMNKLNKLSRNRNITFDNEIDGLNFLTSIN